MAGTGPAFEDDLESLGFVDQGGSRRGGRQWSLRFNSYLTFIVHDFDDSLVLSWSFALGDYVLTRDMQIGAGETTFQELYPRHDVKLPVDAEAVGREITRVLTTLRLDLGDPSI